jgi:cytoskeletal protein RodZ
MQVEEHLKKCKLCTEALEGYKSRGSKSYLHSDVEYLSRKVRRQYNSRSYSPGKRMPVFIAFTLAVFLLIVAIILYILHQNIINQKAQQKVKADSSAQTKASPADTSRVFHVEKSK